MFIEESGTAKHAEGQRSSIRKDAAGLAGGLLEVTARPDVSPIAYDVTRQLGLHVYRVPAVAPVTYRVDYQPGDGHRPEITVCECSTIYSARGQLWGCEHIAAVIEYRRAGSEEVGDNE